jgi:Ca-activated chloride channel homolog
MLGLAHQTAFGHGQWMEADMATHLARLNETEDFHGRLVLLIALMTAFLPTLPAAHAQSCAQCPIRAAQQPTASTSEWTFSKQVNEVHVLFLAMHNRKLITNLSQADISVQDDGKAPAAIVAFRTERELPLRVAMVIDSSSSVTSRFRFEQGAASLFLRQTLQQENDLAFVMGFDNHPKVTQDFVHDGDLLAQGIAQLHPEGGTALYDAIRMACQKLQQRPEQEMVARLLVVLSDGQNNAGSVSLGGAVDAAQRAEVTIYAVSTNFLSSEFDLAADLGNKNLRRLAEQTGGRVLMPPCAKAMSQAFRKIGQEFRSRYAISYRPADFVPDGRYRKIKIEAHRTGEKVQIRARKGYYANFGPGTGRESGAETNFTLASR